MKKFITLLIVCIFVLGVASTSFAVATRMYGRSALIGGTKSVDNIAYANLADGDLCIVITDAGQVYFYRFESSSTQDGDDSPWVIQPDDQAGTGDWELTTSFMLGRTAIPAHVYRDSSCTDKDNNVKVYVECSDTGSGTEDCDYFIQVQIAGTLTTVFKIDADGNIVMSLPTSRLIVEIDKSADAVSLTALECSDTIITTRGWDGVDEQTFTLPEADTSVGAGLRFILLPAVTDADTDLYLDPEGITTQLYIDGVACGDGERLWLDNPTIGESLECYTATLDGTTYDWFCVNRGVASAWADKGS